MRQHPVNKYLSEFAEQEVKLLSNFPNVSFNHVLIIPAYNETPDFLENYISGPCPKLLLILIINQPDDDPCTAPQDELYSHIANNLITIWQSNHLSLHPLPNGCALLCIRRYEDDLKLHHKQGVGLARKIAADCALQLIQSMHIQSEWIASTDADAYLPIKYFDHLALETSAAAQTFEFEHEVNNSPVSQATQCYELSLRYYQAGLSWAGSRYNLHTLGSCLAVNALDYAKVRGFPKRSGGEDFYLLNKLNKVGSIVHRSKIVIQITSRESDRVPFGTGPAISKILKLNQIADFEYYDPGVFAELKQCLGTIERLEPALAFEDWQALFEPLHFEILNSFGLERIYEHVQHQNLNQDNLQHNLFVWFDGLLTLRFIHAIRDQRYPNIRFAEALEKAPFYAT